MSYKAKCKVLHWVGGKPGINTGWGVKGLGRTQNILVDEKWDILGCVLTAQNVHYILNFWDYPPQHQSGERRRLQ